jgi:hypothetical protein
VGLVVGLGVATGVGRGVAWLEIGAGLLEPLEARVGALVGGVELWTALGVAVAVGRAEGVGD